MRHDRYPSLLQQGLMRIIAQATDKPFLNHLLTQKLMNADE